MRDFDPIFSMFRTNLVGIVLWDEAGMFRRANEEFERITGYSREDFDAGVHYSRILAPEYYELIASRSDELLSNGFIPPLEIEYVRKDGSRIPVEIATAQISSRKFKGAAFVLDLTDKKRVEGQAAKTGEFLQAMAAAVPGMIYLIDLKTGAYEFASQGTQAILGYSPDRFLDGGMGFAIPLIHPEDLPRVLERRAETLERITQEPHEVQQAFVYTDEYRMRHASGEWRWLRASMRILSHAPDGSIGKVLGVALDITEHKLMESRLAMLDRMATAGRLAAGVAHEINNPLAHLLACVELAAERSRDTAQPVDARLADVTDRIAGMRDSIERIMRITRDLKTFSRPEDQALGPVDVAASIEATLPMAMGEIRHRARLVREYCDGVPAVHANEGRLNQVLLNLLINAAQSIPAGDADSNEIRIAVRHRVDENRVAIEISDTGSGIPEKLLRQIFDPFFTTKPVGMGTGLGLAICKSIVESLKGEIEVESQAGRGTRFRVLLPVSAQAVGSELPGEDPVHPGLRIDHAGSPVTGETGEPDASERQPHVLIVEDDDDVAGILLEGLKGHSVCARAAGGLEALHLLLGSERFDVVLCDVMMPQMTGLDLFDAIKRSRPGLEERFVFLTGGALALQDRKKLGRLPNPVLEKPFRLAALRTIVQSLTAGSSSRSRTAATQAAESGRTHGSSQG